MKLTDFTLTMRKDWAQYFNHTVCSANFRPMEVWTDVAWNEKVDMWSLGCLFHFMKYKCNIFSNQSDFEMGEAKGPWMDALKHWEDIYAGRSVPKNPEGYFKPRLDPKFNKSKKHDSIMWKLLNPIAKYRWSADRLLQKYYDSSVLPYNVYTINRTEEIIEKKNLQAIKLKSPNICVTRLATQIFSLIPDVERVPRLEVSLRLACKFIFLTSSIDPRKYKGEMTLEEISSHEINVCKQLKFLFPIFD